MASGFNFPKVTDDEVTTNTNDGAGTIILDGKAPNTMTISGLNISYPYCNVLIMDSEGNSYNNGNPIGPDPGFPPLQITFTATSAMATPSQASLLDDEVVPPIASVIRSIPIYVTVTNHPGGAGGGAASASPQYPKLTQVK